MIEVSFCGFHTHNQDKDIIYRENGTSSYLFLIALSPMIFYFKDREPERAKTDACILFKPNTYQHYEAENEFFNSYVHFICDSTVLRKYNLQFNKLFYPSKTDELNWLIKKIHQEHISRLDEWEDMTDMYMRQLLICLSREGQQFSIPHGYKMPFYYELLALREQMLTNCEQDWSVDQMCRILNIGKNQFHKYYKAFFHSTPKEELIQVRLQKAKYLMSNDTITIKEAAYQAGFQNIYHFNRIFKAKFACTPSEYRLEH